MGTGTWPRVMGGEQEAAARHTDPSCRPAQRSPSECRQVPDPGPSHPTCSRAPHAGRGALMNSTQVLKGSPMSYLRLEYWDLTSVCIPLHRIF